MTPTMTFAEAASLLPTKAELDALLLQVLGTQSGLESSHRLKMLELVVKLMAPAPVDQAMMDELVLQRGLIQGISNEVALMAKAIPTGTTPPAMPPAA